MHDLSLHLLDLLENSIAAGSSIVAIELRVDPDADRLRLVVDDDGSGLTAQPDEALNPFYTTKSHKHVGLGLSLLQAAAEQSGGSMSIGSSPELGGARVDVSMRLSHIDRPPIGNLAATVSTMVSAHPQVEFRGRFGWEDQNVDFSTRRDLNLEDPIAASMEAYKILNASFKCPE
ncbi:MAG: sensor histidine kinase [Acidobacteria bacterium]|nr:sensor histidine kinase [Acidobacteriota bacterium]